MRSIALHVRCKSCLRVRPTQAATNLRNHGVSFDEAITSFFDTNAISEPDPNHSAPGDERLIHIGNPPGTASCLWFIMKKTGGFESSAPGWPAQPRDHSMKNPETSAAASAKRTAVRGKYANLLQRGTNIAVLDADIVEHFPGSESVNNALRAFLAIGKQVQSASIRVLPKAPRSVKPKPLPPSIPGRAQF